MGKTKFALIIGHSAIRTDHSEVLFDYKHEFDLPLANHVINLWVLSSVQFRHLVDRV